MSTDMLIIFVAVLAFIAIVGVGFAFSGGNEKAKKRAKQVASNQPIRNARRKGEDENSRRRKQNQQMLAKLREDGKKRKSIVPQDIGSKISQAGLNMSVGTFWVLSICSGLVFALLAFVSGADGITVQGIELRSRIVVIIGSGFAGTLGFPRWVLGFLAKGRAKKMTNQFADALDIIVRGVKSGLPLTECLRIIAAESPAPLGTEFDTLTDSVAMGSSLERSLQALYERVPLPEINFFVIVLSIQAKAGGNLSEALGNLSAVIRSRRMMREKVGALSSEAKASAGIIGALPFVVGGLVFMTQPDYIMLLFLTETGHFFLFLGAGMLTVGVTVMRKMINFDM